MTITVVALELCNTAVAKAQELFKVEREFTAPGIEGEYAFLTSAMPESEFDQAAGQLKVLSRIRAEL